MIPSRMMTLFVLISLAGHITVLSAAGLVGLSPEPAGEELFQVELTAPAPEDSTNRTALPRGFKKASGTPGLGRYRGEDTVELGSEQEVHPLSEPAETTDRKPLGIPSRGLREKENRDGRSAIFHRRGRKPPEHRHSLILRL